MVTIAFNMVDGARGVLLVCVCLWAVGCGFHQSGATSDETAGVQSPDTEYALEQPPAPDDPPQENPVRTVIDESESQRPVAGDSEREAVPENRPDPLIEGLFSSWTDAQLIDLLFPDNGFQRGPEFLDGGPNTLFRICIGDGTPEYLCRQRYAP